MDIERIFFILVLLTPLVIIPKMEVGWEIGKVYWVWTVVEAWLGYRVLKSQLPKKQPWQLVTLVIWLLVVLASSVVSGGEAYWGGWWRRQGFWFIAHLALLYYLVSSAEISHQFVQKLIIVIGILSLVVGVIMGGRLSGAMLEPNNLGMLIAISVLLSFENKFWLAFALTSVGLVLASSRAAVLAFLPALVRLPRKLAVVILVASCIFLAWMSWLRGGGERLALWQATWRLWSNKPWLGIGLDNFQHDFSVQMLNKGLQWRNYDQPHNLVLWLLVSTGSLGLASFAGWLVVIFRKAQHPVWIRVSVAILIFSLFQPLSVSVWSYLFIFFALM